MTNEQHITMTSIAQKSARPVAGGTVGGKHWMVRAGNHSRIPAAHELYEAFGGELEAMMAPDGWEAGRAGKVVRKNVACPVNGDGYWYMRQEILDSEGRVCGFARRDDLGGGEL